MSLPSETPPPDVFRPLSNVELDELARAHEAQESDDNFVRVDDDGTITFEIPAAIVDTPTPYEIKPRAEGVVGRMMKTHSFRAHYRATEQLSKLGAQSSLSYMAMGQIFTARALLAYAKEEALDNPDVTPEFYLRIQLAEAMSHITAYTGSIIETHDQPRMVESYEKLFIPDVYDELIALSSEVQQKIWSARGEERASYSGFAHELVFHLMHYRRKSAERFTTAASVYDDYFRKGQRFDATAYNLEVGQEKSVDVQIKTRPEQLELADDADIRVVYGGQDLHNVRNDVFWEDTMQTDRPLPTLSALIDEAAGDTMDSEKLDQIAERLHNKLFS